MSANDTRSSNAANLGPFRPPLVLLCSILLGVGLRLAMPRRFAPASLAVPVGVVLVLASIALFIAAVRCFRAAGTPIPGNRPTTTIVGRGPYRFSRNPIYLSFYGFQLGLAFWTNNLWQLATLIGTVGLLALVVVPREERYLEARRRIYPIRPPCAGGFRGKPSAFTPGPSDARPAPGPRVRLHLSAAF